VGGSRSKAALTGEQPVEGKLEDPTRADALRGVDDDGAGAGRDAQEIIDIQLADDPQPHIDRQAVAEEGRSRNWSTVVAPIGRAAHKDLDGDGTARCGRPTV
jgi:hypothetical protein